MVVNMVSRWSGPADCSDILLALHAMTIAGHIQFRIAYIQTRLNFLATALSRGMAVCAPPTFVLDKAVFDDVFDFTRSPVILCSDIAGCIAKYYVHGAGCRYFSVGDSHPFDSIHELAYTQVWV